MSRDETLRALVARWFDLAQTPDDGLSRGCNATRTRFLESCAHDLRYELDAAHAAAHGHTNAEAAKLRKEAERNGRAAETADAVLTTANGDLYRKEAARLRKLADALDAPQCVQCGSTMRVESDLCFNCNFADDDGSSPVAFVAPTEAAGVDAANTLPPTTCARLAELVAEYGAARKDDESPPVYNRRLTFAMKLSDILALAAQE